jgi:hypothetical protein
MKLVTLLLSAYMTFLALMPCQDKEGQGAISFDTTISKSNSCNDKAGQETCSPFCTCNCCSIARYIAAQPITTSVILELAIDYPAYKIPVIQQQSLDIWQPPQTA